jgi:hypothetical protein
MKITNCVLTTFLGISGFVSTLPASAQDGLYELPGYVTQSVIDGDALSHTRGRFAVNMAAGDSNAQVNAGALAIDPSGGSAVANVISHQSVGQNSITAPDLSIAIIGDRAFTNSVGAISVNQTSGVGNTQANGMAIALGVEVEAVSESLLSATASGVGLNSVDSNSGDKAATISNTAFQGSHGLVQINQSAGSGNSTANNFAFQLQLGVKH